VVWDTPVMATGDSTALIARHMALFARRMSLIARRTALIAGVASAPAFLALTVALASSSPALAAPVGTQFVPVPASVVWPATMADGTPESSTVTVDIAEVAPGAKLPGGAQLSSGRSYFYVALHPSYAYSIDPHTPIAMPPTTATLLTPQGTIAGIRTPPSSFTIDASWYFPVATGLTSATLQVASFTKVLGNDRGDFTQWTFNPTPISLVAQPVASASAPGAGHAPVGGVGSTSSSPATRTTTHSGGSGGGTPVGVLLRAGAAAAVVLGAARAGLVSVKRRRAFSRADREGRIVFTGPPALVAGSVLAGAAKEPQQQSFVVELLGPLGVQGTTQPVTAGPLLELICYLVLHPGESFTSVQIRESVWGLGRQPITSATFRNYMVALRKAFRPGVVVTDVYRYQLTDAVVCDWDLFRNSMAADDELAGQEEALALVRGPVLHGSFDGKKNAPFAWAVGIANDIEDRVTTAAVELAIACLDLDDPSRSDKAIFQGLLCADSNLRLRILDLEVGAALGGPKEVGRRLREGRAAVAGFPGDVIELEERARQLGWQEIVLS
jgi:hypothetical protein